MYGQEYHEWKERATKSICAGIGGTSMSHLGSIKVAAGRHKEPRKEHLARVDMLISEKKKAEDARKLELGVAKRFNDAFKNEEVLDGRVRMPETFGPISNDWAVPWEPDRTKKEQEALDRIAKLDLKMPIITRCPTCGRKRKCAT